MSFPKGIMDLILNILEEFLDTFITIEVKVDQQMDEANAITLLNDLEQFYETCKITHSQTWKKVVQKAGIAIVGVAKHIEDYNNYQWADKSFGDLRRPKTKDCSEKESCQKCRIASSSDNEKFEKDARSRNSRYLFLAKRYFDNCFETTKYQEFSSEDKKQLDYLKIGLEKTYNMIEAEIDKIVVKGKEFILWKDLDDLYGTIDILYSKNTFGTDHIDDKPLIKEEWMETVSRIELFFYELAEHVGEYCVEFKKLLAPISERSEWKVNRNSFSVPCNEKNKCKKCVESQIPTGALANKTKLKTSDEAGCLTQKPYNYERTKINFTLDDLENSSEDDDYQPGSAVMPGTSERK